MRPLVVSHTARVDNPNQFILGLLRNRPPDAQPSCVFLEDGPDVEAVRDLGVEARIMRAGRTREAWRVPGVVLALARHARERRADLILSQTSKAQVYASPAATLGRVPDVWFQTEVPGWARGVPGQGRWLQELAGRLPNHAVVCTSDFVARHHLQRWPRAVVRRVYPGVTTEGIPVRHHAARGAVCVAVVGRLQRWRRIELALDALALVLREEPGVRLMIVGDARADFDADYPGQLRSRAAALGIAHAVDFLGHVPDAAGHIADADLLLHVADREPFGQLVVDALLRGVPAIVPPLGGPAEIVRDGIDGLVVDPTDSAALAAAIAELARDPARRAALGAAGRKRALECFDAKRMAADTWELLEEVVRGPLAAEPAPAAR